MDFVASILKTLSKCNDELKAAKAEIASLKGLPQEQDSTIRLIPKARENHPSAMKEFIRQELESTLETPTTSSFGNEAAIHRPAIKNPFSTECEKAGNVDCECVNCYRIAFKDFLYATPEVLVRETVNILADLKVYSDPLVETKIGIQKAWEALRILSFKVREIFIF